MILTCPDCATRYFVDDAKLGGAGKTVRCASCGARWTARATDEPEMELTASPEIGAMAVETAPAPSMDAQPFPEALPKTFRAKVAEKSAMKRAVVHGVIWGSMFAALAATIAVSIVFRVEFVRLMPRAASAYAMAGLKVNAIGLTFENVSAHPALQDGHAALVVSGTIRNIESQAVDAPPLRINVLTRAGAHVATLVRPIEDARIAPGQSHSFVISVLDPPPTAETVEVVFEIGARSRGLRAPAGHAVPHLAAAAPALRPAVEEEPMPAVLLPATDTAAAPPPLVDALHDPLSDAPAHAPAH